MWLQSIKTYFKIFLILIIPCIDDITILGHIMKCNAIPIIVRIQNASLYESKNLDHSFHLYIYMYL